MFIKIGPKFHCFCSKWGHQLVMGGGGQFACISVDKETTLTGSVVAVAAMTVLSQSQPETQSPIGPPSSPPKRQTIIGC